jgi:predicted nuclease of predicted toxin-antitoxin system
MKLLFDESLSPRLVELLRDLFPESESAPRNGLAGLTSPVNPRRLPRVALT